MRVRLKRLLRYQLEDETNTTMAKRIESYNSFEESEKANRTIALNMSMWERWVKGVELSEIAIKWSKAAGSINSSDQDTTLFKMYLPKKSSNENS